GVHEAKSCCPSAKPNTPPNTRSTSFWVLVAEIRSAQPCGSDTMSTLGHSLSNFRKLLCSRAISASPLRWHPSEHHRVGLPPFGARFGNAVPHFGHSAGRYFIPVLHCSSV